MVYLDGEARFETINANKKKKTGTAAGPGDIPIELIKSGGQKLLEMINILFNKVINGEKVPEEWKIAIITLIHKKGDKRKCENYRGISVTSTFSRNYGRILAKLVESEYKNGMKVTTRIWRWKNNQVFELEGHV